MRFIIKHKIRGRLRIHILNDSNKILASREADLIEYCIKSISTVLSVKVYERSGNVAICYIGEQDDIINELKSIDLIKVKLPLEISDNSSRELGIRYKERLILHIALRLLMRHVMPKPLRILYIGIKAFKYICVGVASLIKGRMDVQVLDAVAIAVSISRSDYSTAGSVIFLLGIGEILEEWTHRKSVCDLARSMCLNIRKVWIRSSGQEILVDTKSVQVGDEIVIRAGAVIPFDGEVVSGEAMINQSSLTGEGIPIFKEKGGYAYAGTVIEEGEIIIRVKEVDGQTRYDKIVSMIEDTQKLKSVAESRADHIADWLVPVTFAGTGLAWLTTHNVMKALSVLMVDFSCALKLAMPIAVLSAIREANVHSISIKGGKYLEAVSDANTIVFDKTGTLTKARPRVKDIVSFSEMSKDELLRLAACLEEHFPHSMAKAVVKAAKEKGLEHDEMHSKVDYVVAHGIASYIDGKRVTIGSHHFIFEDEQCIVKSGYQDRYSQLPLEYSHLYMAIDKELVSVILVEDPLRDEVYSTIRELRNLGIDKIVMLTGDSERTASAIASKIGVDEYHSEVLPEDKANYILNERAKGGVVIMVGDGINDSPALSAANVGIAISDGAEIAREIADITIAADDLRELVILRMIGIGLMKRIDKNYRTIIGVNASLIAYGLLGLMLPTTSAMIHNASTILIALNSTRDLLE